MRETPAAWSASSGGTYAPPPVLRSLGRVLAADEPCPTLFRYPGPLGLASLLSGATTRLGPGTSPFVWLAASAGAMSGSERFGAVAILEPLRLQPCEMDAALGHWLALDVAVSPADEHAVWVPPSTVARPLDWDTLRNAAQVRELIGGAHDAELAAVKAALGAYLEELSALRSAGAAGPPLPWHQVAVEERRRVLAQHGIEGRWTR